MEKHIHNHLKRLKKMGWTFIGLAGAVSLIIFILPNQEANYWLSSKGKEGFYVLSTFLTFLGFYCLGAIWRKRNFI